MDAPPVIDSPRRRPAWRAMVALPLAAMAAVTLVLYLFNPAQHGFYPRCLLFVMTGIYCPGCGGLRAMHQLTHGHLLAALHDNALFVLSLPFFAIFGWRWVGCWLKDAPLPRFNLSARWIAVIVVVMLVFTVLRNIRSEPFTWLAPI